MHCARILGLLRASEFANLKLRKPEVGELGAVRRRTQRAHCIVCVGGDGGKAKSTRLLNHSGLNLHTLNK